MADRGTLRAVVASATPYDILGYLLPGGAVVLCRFFFEFWLVRVDKADTTNALLPTYALFHELSNGLSDPRARPNRGPSQQSFSELLSEPYMWLATSLPQSQRSCWNDTWFSMVTDIRLVAISALEMRRRAR
jgi:hypothetical protein